MNLLRSSGVQLHPTSLPGGRLGREAYAFVDWLAAAGQAWWQMLPLGPPDRYGSPYKSHSAFAAWPGLLAEPRAPVTRAEEIGFRERNAYWIEDWGRFGPRGAIADQVRFDREWAALRRYAADRGVRLIGDVPIYVAPGSADHKAHPELFQSGAVAGTPPDAFTDKGQLWGNPLYDWPALRRRRYRWWTERLRRTFDLYDLARIDHFRGFVAYWAVPARARHALSGRWKRGPGPRGVRRRAGRARPRAAADRGGPRGDHARRSSACATASGSRGWRSCSTRSTPTRTARTRSPTTASTRSSTPARTTTTPPAAGTTRSTSASARAVDAAIDPGDEPHWALIRAAFSSRAALAMVQAQDVLGLGSEARMNKPGTTTGSWKWRLAEGALTPDLAKRLREASEAGQRLRA